MRRNRTVSAKKLWATTTLTWALLTCTALMVSAAPDTVDANIKIPVVTSKVAQGLIMVGPSVKGIEIQVAGSAKRMKVLQESKLEYELDLTGLNDGIHTIPIVPEQIRLPQGISILKLNTRSITLRIDKEIRKKIPIAVSLHGEAAPGFHVTEALAMPDRAVLRGPRHILDDIEHVSTNPIDLAGASEPFKKEITLDLMESVTVLFPSGPILVQIGIAEKMITKTFQDLEIAGRNTDFSFRVTPPTITIDVKGPANIVNTLKTSKEFDVYMDLDALKPGVYVRRATITLPVATALVGVRPEIFTVTIKEE